MNIILLHGLWMRGFSLMRLVARLRTEGHQVETFDYLSLAHAPERTQARLRERVLRVAGDGRAPGVTGEGIALIGHSLGGVMAAKTVQTMPDLPVSRVLALGSPLAGAQAARTLAHRPGTSVLLGKSRDLLCDGLGEWTSPVPLGVVAGRLPYGLGMILPLTGEHDGTVQVAETRLPGLHDHAVVAATHTGLLFSDEVAQLSLRFLAQGRFSP